MKRFITALVFMVLVSVTVSGFAKTTPFPKELFDILPWDVETGEWKERPVVPGDMVRGDVFSGEDPEKGRQEEDKTEKKEEAKQEADGQKKEVKSVDLIVILDRSGSMYGMEEDTIGGFNSVLEEQRKQEVPVRVTLITFNNAVNTLYNRVDVKEVKNMTKEDYTASGTTALLDAVGNTLSGLKTNAEVNAEGNKVLMVITTDGKENASKEWSAEKVKALITEMREKGYEFVFLGADIDAVSVAEGIGIKAENSVKFKKTAGADGGVRSNFKAMNVMMRSVVDGESLEESASWKNSIVKDE